MIQRLRWALAALLGSVGMVWAQAPALNGQAQRHADQAYQAYAQQDYAKALEQAKAARRLRPDVVQLQQLVLMTHSAFEHTQIAPNTRPAANPREQMLAQTSAQTSAQVLGRELAQKAYQKVMESRQDPALISWARSFIWQALQYDNQPLEWHVLAVRLALAQHQWNDALYGAEQGLKVHANEPALVQAKAFVLQQKGQGAQAFDLLLQCLETPGLSADDRASLLLQAVDTALNARLFEQGQVELAQLLAQQVPGARERQRLLQAGAMLPLTLPMPALGCNEQALCVARYALNLEAHLAGVADVASTRSVQLLSNK